jgi:hypothetical protein
VSLADFCKSGDFKERKIKELAPIRRGKDMEKFLLATVKYNFFPGYTVLSSSKVERLESEDANKLAFQVFLMSRRPPRDPNIPMKHEIKDFLAKSKSVLPKDKELRLRTLSSLNPRETAIALCQTFAKKENGAKFNEDLLYAHKGVWGIFTLEQKFDNGKWTGLGTFEGMCDAYPYRLIIKDDKLAAIDVSTPATLTSNSLVFRKLFRTLQITGVTDLGVSESGLYLNFRSGRLEKRKTEFNCPINDGAKLSSKLDFLKSPNLKGFFLEIKSKAIRLMQNVHGERAIQVVKFKLNMTRTQMSIREGGDALDCWDSYHSLGSNHIAEMNRLLEDKSEANKPKIEFLKTTFLKRFSFRNPQDLKLKDQKKYLVDLKEVLEESDSESSVEDTRDFLNLEMGFDISDVLNEDLYEEVDDDEPDEFAEFIKLYYDNFESSPTVDQTTDSDYDTQTDISFSHPWWDKLIDLQHQNFISRLSQISIKDLIQNTFDSDPRPKTLTWLFWRLTEDVRMEKIGLQEPEYS